MNADQQEPEEEPTPGDHPPPLNQFEMGVELFNRAEYYEAHEVWEDLWRECPAKERRFVQALIQAAVAVYHFGRGNNAGAVRLFHSGRRYMEPYQPLHMGLDVEQFWRDVASHLAPALRSGPPGPHPRITLQQHPPSPAG